MKHTDLFDSWCTQMNICLDMAKVKHVGWTRWGQKKQCEYGVNIDRPWETCWNFWTLKYVSLFKFLFNFTWILNKFSLQPPNLQSGKCYNDITICVLTVIWQDCLIYNIIQQFLSIPQYLFLNQPSTVEDVFLFLFFLRMWLKACQALLCFSTFLFWATAENQQVRPLQCQLSFWLMVIDQAHCIGVNLVIGIMVKHIVLVNYYTIFPHLVV